MKLRLLGGLMIWVTTLYCAPKTRTGTRRGPEGTGHSRAPKTRTGTGRGPEGTGHYPELAALGIRKGVTPALQAQVGRLTALLPSIDLARDELRQQGPTLDEKAVHRIARQLGAEALTARTRQLQQYRAGRLAAGPDLAGQHVVAQLDGGRVRTRVQIETTKRKGVKHRRKIRLEWREPKLLIIYRSDRRGRMIPGTRPWIDGTLQGPDHVMELLAMHLHRLGAARAQKVTFVADGAPWIWGRLDWVERRVGLDPRRVERVLDTCHAVHHISLALKALGLSETERDQRYQELRRQLRAGRSRDVVATLRALAQGQPEDSAVWVEIAFLHKHEPHMRYDWLKYRGRPLGSGAIESAMRRVLNQRLKGNGIYWREENAEGMLVLRAAVLSGRWTEVMAATHAAMGADRRRDWKWSAPDMVAELNAGAAIKPPVPQPESSDQAGAIAA